MSASSEPWWLGAFAYLSMEPADRPEWLVDTMQAIVSELGVPPDKASVYRWGGREGRWLKFGWERVQEFLGVAEAGAIDFLWGTSREVAGNANFKLRHNPLFRGRQPDVPIRFYLVGRIGPEDFVASNAEGAALVLMHRVAASMACVYGGITRLATFNQVISEVSTAGQEVRREPPDFVRRWNFDAGLEFLLWTHARRLYSVNLFGPELARKLGGAEAARAAGALEVTEKHGALIVRATEEILDSHDPEFFRQTVRLRRWLWPHTIQNPMDAEGLDLTLGGA